MLRSRGSGRAAWVSNLVGGGSIAGQPVRTLFTAAMISSMVISLSPLASPAMHSKGGKLPSAMFTIVMTSLTVTWLSPLQLPTHGSGVAVVVAA